ncbi:MAG: HEAT repeat domain-containing protein [Candidatus Heimdallarchaeaceae archaeon]
MLKSNQIENFKLTDVKDYKILVKFLSEENDTVRKNAAQLLFSTDFVPVKEILTSYFNKPSTFIENIISEKLYLFIPILYEYLIKDEYFPLLFKFLSQISPVEIYRALEKAYKTTPTFVGLTELSLRTCHSSFANYEQSFIDFGLISEQSSKIKQILLHRLKQQDEIFSELTLLVITQFPELGFLVLKQIKEIIGKSKNEELVKYGSIALMHLNESKNADVVMKRLEKDEDSTSTKLVLIETLGNLGNKKATKILIQQFSSGETEAYYAAKSLALIGEVTLPELISVLDVDQYVPFIIETMKRIGESSFDYLMKALQKGNKRVRRNAAQCLTLVMSQKYGYEGAIRLLTSQLAGKNSQVIEAVTQSLLTLGTPSIKILIEELNDDDLNLRKNAIEVLGYFGVANIELELDRLFDIDLSSAVRLGIILYLYYPSRELQELGYSFAMSKGKLRIKGDEIFQLLLKTTKEIDPLLRGKACELLVGYGVKAVPILTSLLEDHNIQVRRKAVESLRKIKSKRALITLIKAAKDSDDTIAEIATRALGELRDPGVLDVITFNMRRAKTLVREASIYAAVNIGPPISRKLSNYLSNSNPKLVEGSISALSQMDGKILENFFSELKSCEEKWLLNFQKVVEKMGKRALPSLRKMYKKAKAKKQKERILLLLSIAKDKSIIPDIIELLVSGNSKLAVNCINNLGISNIKFLLDEIEKQPKATISTISTSLKGLKIEVLLEILNVNNKNKKLKKFYSELIKNHSKLLRKWCVTNKIDYNEFVKKYK